MTTITEAESAAPEETWPSLPLAYEYVRPSYDWSLRRYDAVENRLQSVLTFAATFTVGAPVLTSAVLGKSLQSPWLALAFGLFAILAAICIGARTVGIFVRPAPGKLRDIWLHKPVWQFQADMLYWAQEDLRHNTLLINGKGYAASVASALLLIEMVIMVVWLTI